LSEFVQAQEEDVIDAAAVGRRDLPISELEISIESRVTLRVNAIGGFCLLYLR
jgi:hypothetical protein